MKKNILFVLAASLMLAACSGGGETPSSSSPTDESSSSSSETVTQYTVTLINAKSSATISTSTLDSGSSFAKPSDPSYADHIFAGWYLDSSLTSVASFPISVTSNITIYAKFNTYKEHFLEARDKTILSSDSFQYSSSTNLNVSHSLISGYSLNGNQEGTTSYNASSVASFLETHSNSGSLFYDGYKTTYKKGNTLFRISENEDHDVTDYESETVDSSFRYDSSSFAKALFEYSEDDITSVEKSGSKYELKTSWNFSKVATTILSQVNNKYVEMILGSLPETESSFHMYVTFDSEAYLSSYSYEFSVEVQGITVAVTYNLTFLNNGKDITITEPSFPGLYLTEEEINGVLGTIKDGISAYKNLEFSAYDYRIDSTVDVADIKSVGVTSKGKSKRKVSNSVVYYHNVLEVDSEHKDSDMYKDAGVEDYKRTRAKLADGTVYDAYDRAWPLSNEFTEVTNPLLSDEFYGLISSSLLTAEYVDAVQKTSETANDEYSLVINQELFEAILTFVNDITRLDYTLANHYLALGSYTESSLEMKDASFIVDITNGVFSGLQIKLDGNMYTSYPDTAIAGDSSFDLSITIETTDDGANYVIPETTDDIEL